MERRDEETEKIEKQLAEGQMEIEKTLDEYLKLKVLHQLTCSIDYLICSIVGWSLIIWEFEVISTYNILQRWPSCT